MKRREFLRSAGAAAVLPVLPLSAMTAPVVAAPANTMQVGWAALYARANNQASPALIQKWLRVGPEQAQALMSELTKRQIIHTPVAGSAAAVQPMYPSSGIPGAMKRTQHFVQKARDVYEDWIEDEVEETETTLEPEMDIEPKEEESHGTS